MYKSPFPNECRAALPKRLRAGLLSRPPFSEGQALLQENLVSYEEHMTLGFQSIQYA